MVTSHFPYPNFSLTIFVLRSQEPEENDHQTVTKETGDKERRHIPISNRTKGKDSDEENWGN